MKNINQTMLWTGVAALLVTNIIWELLGPSISNMLSGFGLGNLGSSKGEGMA